MPRKPRHIDIKEFREAGYLQEVNREFLHPLGLAIEVRIDDDGTETLSGVWDYRDDPEGILFADAPVEELHTSIALLRAEKRRHRATLDYCDDNGIQMFEPAPAPETEPRP